jgi:hypothetical protein
MFSMVFSGKNRKTKEKQQEKATLNTNRQVLTENYIYFLNIIAMICKNKYSSFGIIQTMV